MCQQIGIAALLHPRILESFPRILFPETIKLQIHVRGSFHVQKNSCRTCQDECVKALWLQARKALYSQVNWDFPCVRNYMNCCFTRKHQHAVVIVAWAAPVFQCSIQELVRTRSPHCCHRPPHLSRGLSSSSCGQGLSRDSASAHGSLATGLWWFSLPCHLRNTWRLAVSDV